MEKLLNNGSPEQQESAPSDQNTQENQTKYAIELPEGLTSESVVNQSKQYYKIWESGTSDKRKEVADIHGIVNGKIDQPTKSKNRAFFSVVNSIKDTIVSRISKAISGRDKLVDVIPEFASVDKNQQKAVEDFVNQCIIYNTRGQQKAKSFISAATIEGAGFYRDYWHVCTEKVLEPQYAIDPMTGQQVYMGDLPQSIQYGKWMWDEVSPGDLFYDPSATLMSESPWAGVRATMSLNELREWEAAGKIQDVDSITNITPSGVRDREDWEKKMQEAKSSGSNFAYGGNREYLVDEWWGTLSWNTQETGENGETKTKVNTANFHWIIIENSVLVKAEANPLIPERKPVGAAPYNIDPRKIWGISALKPVKPLQDMINTFGSKQLDLIEQAVNGKTYYDSRSGLTSETWLQRTQGLIPVDNVDGIKEGSVDPTAVNVNQGWLNFCIGFARQETAATDQSMGLQGQDMTATEFQGLAAMAGSRLDDIIDNFMQFWIAPMAQSCLEHYQQYGIDGQMFVSQSSIDGQPIAITRQMLAGKWRVVPATASTEMNKAQRIKLDNEFLQQMMAFNQAAMANPMQTGGKLYDIGKHVTEISLALRDSRNAQDFFIELPAPVMPPGPLGPPSGPVEGSGGALGGGSPPPSGAV